MNHDPIFETFRIVINRIILFVVLGVSFGLAVWLWLWLSWFDLPATDMPSRLREAFSPLQHQATAVFVWGSQAIGFLITVIIYLVVTTWWKKRGDVYRRGARPIQYPDSRE